MNIGILGAKKIGGTLGRKWARAGHTIRFGVRSPRNPELESFVRDLGNNASVGSVADAITFSEVVLFAIPGTAMEETIRANAGLLKGKIVIDAANKVGSAVMNSLADFTQHSPGALVYRAFNSLGWENFEDPTFGNTNADLFYCGPAGESQKAIETLIEDVGLRPVRLGGPEQVHLVDAVTGIWFALAFGQKMGRHVAFKVLTK